MTERNESKQLYVNPWNTRSGVREINAHKLSTHCIFKTGVPVSIKGTLKTACPWLTECLDMPDAAKRHEYTRMLTKEVTILDSKFPFTRSHREEDEFAHEAIRHFKGSGMIPFLTETWLRKPDSLPWCDTIAESPHAMGVVRFFLHRAPTAEYSRGVVIAMLELKLSKLIAEKRLKPGFSLFQLIIHTYAIIFTRSSASATGDWDTLPVSEWDADWFTRSFGFVRTSALLRSVREAVTFTIIQAHRYTELVALRQTHNDAISATKRRVCEALAKGTNWIEREALSDAMKRCFKSDNILGQLQSGTIRIPPQVSNVKPELPPSADSLAAQLEQAMVDVGRLDVFVALMDPFAEGPLASVAMTEEERALLREPEAHTPPPREEGARAIPNDCVIMDRELMAVTMAINYNDFSEYRGEGIARNALDEFVDFLEEEEGSWAAKQTRIFLAARNPAFRREVRNTVKKLRTIQQKVDEVTTDFARQMVTHEAQLALAQVRALRKETDRFTVNLARRIVTQEVRLVLTQLRETQAVIDRTLDAAEGDQAVFLASAARFLPPFLLAEDVKCTDCGKRLAPDDAAAGFLHDIHDIVCGECAIVYSIHRVSPCAETLTVVKGFHRSIHGGAAANLFKITIADERQARRLFLATAHRYLPSTMLDEVVDCQFCFSPIVWHTSDAERPIFATCCNGLGYVCGACVRASQSHQHTGYTGVVRIITEVRRKLGV